jgi:hypothetical protein
VDVKKQKQYRTAERGRFSAKRKNEAVLRLLKGEELLEGNASGFPWRKSRG